MKGLLSWVNPTTYVDGTPLNPADVAGYELSFDGQAAVGVPLHGAGQSFDMNALEAYTALKRGTHTVALDIVMATGEKSAFSAPATFPVASNPNPPTALAVA